jgi:hypothetical protein
MNRFEILDGFDSELVILFIHKDNTDMPSRTKGKGRAAEVVPEATLPLGKQLAHTGQSCFLLFLPARCRSLILAAHVVDKKIRDQAIANLGAFLSGGGILSLSGQKGAQGEDVVKADTSSDHLLPPLEMRKLWKGLFYCE